MKPYFSVSPITGKPSGVIGYDIEDTYIKVYFKSGKAYTYSVDSCGEEQLEIIKNLAESQHGLNTYLTKNKPPYQSID